MDDDLYSMSLEHLQFYALELRRAEDEASDGEAASRIKARRERVEAEAAARYKARFQDIKKVEAEAAARSIPLESPEDRKSRERDARRRQEDARRDRKRRFEDGQPKKRFAVEYGVSAPNSDESLCRRYFDSWDDAQEWAEWWLRGAPASQTWTATIVEPQPGEGDSDV